MEEKNFFFGGGLFIGWKTSFETDWVKAINSHVLQLVRRRERENIGLLFLKVYKTLMWFYKLHSFTLFLMLLDRKKLTK